jgi:hypothetical protein
LKKVCRSCGIGFDDKYRGRTNFCRSCYLKFNDNVQSKRKATIAKNLVVSLSLNTKRDFKKHKSEEHLGVHQRAMFDKKIMSKRIWEQHFKNDFPSYQRYKNVLKSAGIDPTDLISIKNLMQEYDKILNTYAKNKGDNIFEVINYEERSKK